MNVDLVKFPREWNTWRKCIDLIKLFRPKFKSAVESNTCNPLSIGRYVNSHHFRVVTHELPQRAPTASFPNLKSHKNVQENNEDFKIMKKPMRKSSNNNSCISPLNFRPTICNFQKMLYLQRIIEGWCNNVLSFWFYPKTRHKRSMGSNWLECTSYPQIPNHATIIRRTSNHLITETTDDQVDKVTN